jgi:2-(1,2-epoxy-1,2-dihydrophenyl)acetyl-CoA isomerase
MPYERIRFEVADGVATLTLDRPDAANAMDERVMSELLDAAIACDEDPSVRAVVLTASGDQAFCAGGDLARFSEMGDALPARLKKMTTDLHGAVSRLARMDAPVVTAVNGVAAGGGFSLAVAGDLVLAAASARFTLAYTRAGLTPDGSSTWVLPRLIGLRRAQELMLTNRVLTASEALDWGLVTRVVPDEDLQAEARKLALELAAGPTRAYGSVKRLLLLSEGNALEAQMEHEARAISDAARSDDGREGIAAFLAKRRASFEGR